MAWSYLIVDTVIFMTVTMPLFYREFRFRLTDSSISLVKLNVKVGHIAKVWLNGFFKLGTIYIYQKGPQLKSLRKFFLSIVFIGSPETKISSSFTSNLNFSECSFYLPESSSSRILYHVSS